MLPRERLLADTFDTTTGHFGQYGGQYAPESQMGFLESLTKAFGNALLDVNFWHDFCSLLTQRPSPLKFAPGLTRQGGGAKIWLKREDLSDYGSPNQYSIIGQVLLARRMNKTKILTDCGSAKHGVECAAICSRTGIKCTVFIGSKDAERQPRHIEEIARLGATCEVVHKGCMTLRAATTEALQAATQQFEEAFYIPNSSVAPHPYPWIMRTFESIIGKEVMVQMQENCGSLPQALVAPIGGNGGAIGLFHPFLAFESIKLLGIESVRSSALEKGSRGVFFGTSTTILQDDDGQVLESDSVSPDMNHPGVGPELAHWKQTGRLKCATATDEEALAGQKALNEVESVIAGLDTGHAVGEALKLARQLKPQDNIVLLVTGSDVYPISNGPKIDMHTSHGQSEMSHMVVPEPLSAA
ncbi:uncharacterized protein N7503_007317 [Penicillium pulvis]|uniref:uncharacterized protein n=1 Tax=Penicillium pulvis TaxID=1562058 RepID=UPI0025495D5E|nr:uncharacterized protein N7503_007317 [Penicillium pulvis]KAJ5798021.1 hypothetical protein N7503_007317 [Penicillium pulvis]